MIEGNTDPASPQRWHQISEIFADCLEHDEGDARDAFLRQACADDATLLRQVRALIATEANAQAVLQPTQIAQEMAAATANAADDAEHWLGQRLGAYQIVSVVARGGMGLVFKGLRADREFNKEVAIKLVRDADPNNQLIARFKAERQILASLDHPNIARLIDGGSSEAGWPFLVMEYVDGVPITEFATRHQLNLAARLDLFRKVCAAVHFAHQRLVVHRDLKPSNILVTQAGEVKLLDFGIAKLLEAAPQHGSSAPTLLAMTPAYASPEQVKGEAITTASDVYSLGVVLYELLTGHSPYKSTQTQPLALAKEICDTDPERPSTVVARTEIADVRSPPPVLDPHTLKRLQRGLRGDLDNIVLMALRKDPARRYASAEQLSEDVRRYLENLPVSARTDTFAYRTRKFVARNRWAVGFAVLGSLALISGIVATIHQASVARAAQIRAEKHFGEVRQLANDAIFDFHESIKDLPGATAARKRVVEKALAYLNNMSAVAPSDQKLSQEVGTGWIKLAQIQGDFGAANSGEIEAAQNSYESGLRLLRAAYDKDKTNATIAVEFAQALRLYAAHQFSVERMPQMESNLAQAIAIGDAFNQDRPEWLPNRIERINAILMRAKLSRRLPAQDQTRIATLLNAIADAEKLTAMALSGDEKSRVERALSFAYVAMADAERLDGTAPAMARAADWLDKALQIDQHRLQREPNSNGAQRNLAATLSSAGTLAQDVPGRTEQALAYRTRAADVYALMASRDAGDQTALVNWIYSLATLAETQTELKHYDEAQRSIAEAKRQLLRVDANGKKIVILRVAEFALAGVDSLLNADLSALASASSTERKNRCASARASFDDARVKFASMAAYFQGAANDDPIAELRKKISRCNPGH